MKLLWLLFDLLVDLFSKGNKHIVDINVSSSGGTVGAVAALGASALNLITTLQQEANSPDAVKAAQAKEKLKQWDQLAIAQQTNDITTEREFLERRMAQIQ